MMSKEKQTEYEKSKHFTSKLNKKAREFMRDIKEGKYNLQNTDEKPIVFHTDSGSRIEIPRAKK